MNFSLDQVLTGLAVLLGMGAVGTGGGKAAGMFKAALNMLRQLVLAICGDGTPEHPGLKGEVAALKKVVADLKVTIDKHVDGDAPTWLAEGQAWGHRLEAGHADHEERLLTLETANKDPK